MLTTCFNEIYCPNTIRQTVYNPNYIGLTEFGEISVSDWTFGLKKALATGRSFVGDWTSPLQPTVFGDAE